MTLVQDLMSQAIHVVNANPLALFTTVDAGGVPHGRWMGTTAVDGVRRIYTLAGRHSRKVGQVRHHPAACWVFSSHDCADVVTLLGRARVMDSLAISQTTWERLASTARMYAMGVLSDDANLELVTIQTEVESVELLSPRLRIFSPMELPLD